MAMPKKCILCKERKRQPRKFFCSKCVKVAVELKPDPVALAREAGLV